MGVALTLSPRPLLSPWLSNVSLAALLPAQLTQRCLPGGRCWLSCLFKLPALRSHPIVIPSWEREGLSHKVISLLFLVMDITDIIKGKAESDEEKQHFIPFHP